jgi:hypothetical protein
MKKTTGFGFKTINLEGRDNLQKTEILLARAVVAMLRCGIMQAAHLTLENLAIEGTDQSEEFVLASYIEESGLGIRTIGHGSNAFRPSMALFKMISGYYNDVIVNPIAMLNDIAENGENYASLSPMQAGLMGYL